MAQFFVFANFYPFCWLTLPQLAQLHKDFLVSFLRKCLFYKSISYLKMAPSDKSYSYWSVYSKGSKFGKFIAYGIGAKLIILLAFLSYMMAN